MKFVLLYIFSKLSVVVYIYGNNYIAKSQKPKQQGTREQIFQSLQVVGGQKKNV